MKKGQASLIAWVLLIGFAVTLGIFVFRWSLQQAQRSTEGVEEMIMGDIQCGDVALMGYCEGGQIKVKNKGTLTIDYIIRSGEKNPVRIGGSDGLRPNEEDTISPGIISPIIVIDNKKIVCSEQKQEFVCSS